MERITIRPYRPEEDEVFVYSIWRRTIGHLWPASLDTFHKLTVGAADYQDADHMVTTVKGSVAGFVAIEPPLAAEQTGAIALLAVDPFYQGQGIGSALMGLALAVLRGLGATHVELGGRGDLAFWPGVPKNLPGALAFFQKHGWNLSGACADVVAETEQIRHADSQRSTSVRFETAAGARAAELADLAAAIAPAQREIIDRTIRQNRGEDLLIARAPKTGTLVGAAVLYQAKPGHFQPETRWRAELGEDFGGIAALATMNNNRIAQLEQKIMEEALRRLKERAVRRVLLPAVSDPAEFSEMGFSVWREYQKAWKET